MVKGVALSDLAILTFRGLWSFDAGSFAMPSRDSRAEPQDQSDVQGGGQRNCRFDKTEDFLLPSTRSILTPSSRTSSQQSEPQNCSQG